MRTQRTCLFCPRPANSREHVIAEWLTTRMQMRERGFQAARFIEGKGLALFPKTKLQHFKTKQVCDDCNTGWMSSLEGWFQKRLGVLVEPCWPRLADEMLKVVREESDYLVRWMIKSAVIFERATPKGAKQSVPDEVRTMARNGGLTDGFFQRHRQRFLVRPLMFNWMAVLGQVFAPAILNRNSKSPAALHGLKHGRKSHSYSIE